MTTKKLKTVSKEQAASSTSASARPPTTYSMVLSSEEMLSVIQILSFSKDVFEQMALSSASEGKDQAKLVYAARAQLSAILYAKFAILANIGEPTSRELH